MKSQPLDPRRSSRERLLDAAKRLFATQGYEQTATSAIAREAATSESQLMRYFGGKAGLLDALLENGWAALNSRVARVIDGTESHCDSLIDAVGVMTTAMARDADLAALMMFEGRRIREPRRMRSVRGSAAFMDTIRRVVRQAQSDNEIQHGVHAGAVASALIGAAEAMIRDRWLGRSGGKRYPEREIRRTLECMLEGFKPRSARIRQPANQRRVRVGK